MFDSIDPYPAAPAPGQDPERGRLPADIYDNVLRMLRLALPRPASESPEDLARRERAAVACVVALEPASAVEADLAVQFVVASEHWKDCLRLAQAPGTALPAAAKHRAQAVGMMRLANSALALLVQVQETARKREADKPAPARPARSAEIRPFSRNLPRPGARPA